MGDKIMTPRAKRLFVELHVNMDEDTLIATLPDLGSRQARSSRTSAYQELAKLEEARRIDSTTFMLSPKLNGWFFDFILGRRWADLKER
jgi:hypothetical protein